MSPAAASAADLELARDFVVELEARARRRGVSREDARRRVARDVGVAPGTLETLRRGRLKRVEVWVLRALARATIADLTAELRRHESLLERAETCVVDLDPAEVATLREDIARTREALAALGASAARSPQATPPAEFGARTAS